MAIQVRKAKRKLRKTNPVVRPVTLSMSEIAELKYHELLKQFSALGPEVINDKANLEVVKLARRTSEAYRKFAKRRSSRKFKKFTSFVSLADRLSKELLLMPIPVAATVGDTSAVGTPGIVQA